MANSSNVFIRELKALNQAKEILEQTGDSDVVSKENFVELCTHYESLLGDTRVITNISDRLQNKLNRANDVLHERSEEIKTINDQLNEQNLVLQNTIDELTKTKLSRRAATITIIAAMLLFILSEGLLEPIIEEQARKADYHANWISFAFKGFIALLLKPIEYLIERYLQREAIRKKERQEAVQEIQQKTKTAR
ncbi:hypothetical protein [uncultured Microscilla sp.]|uniref:hypothetical protein n=1 Tax=uncultured Microscilla sp. TaxID=432653 RepID=UPI00261EA48D|nr:hypothetical protein [uncultured Microscilla sp.]